MPDQSPTKRGILPPKSEAAALAACKLGDSLFVVAPHLQFLRDAMKGSHSPPLSELEFHRQPVRAWIEESSRYLNVIQQWPQTAADFGDPVGVARDLLGGLTSAKWLSDLFDPSTHKMLAQLRKDWDLRPRADVKVIRATPIEGEQACVPDTLEDPIDRALRWIADAQRRASTSERSTPGMLAASDLAKLLDMNLSRVESALRRYRIKYSDCYIEVPRDDRRRNLPKYLYRTSDVLPLLQELKKNRP
jgi:hypothetical protein